MIPIARPLVGTEEVEAVLQALTSGQLAQGEQVRTFERRFAELCHVSEARAVSSGTAALYLALLAHGIGAGDEVITTAFSFAATANVILHVGATPVFVDIEPETYTLDPAQVERALSPRTKALLPVHLYGHPADMRSLSELAQTHQLALIEDACQAHAATVDGQPVGSFGTGCFSFYATKNMTTGEGGMVTTNNPQIAERVHLLRNHGQKERCQHTTNGYNLRMTELQGALGLAQIEKLERWTEQRIANAAFLSKHLGKHLHVPITRPGYRHVFHQYTLLVPGERDEWMTRLAAQGISTAVHYPLAIHQQPFYRAHPELFHIINTSKTIDHQLSFTEHVAAHILSLPVHPGLSLEDLSTIIREVLALCR